MERPAAPVEVSGLRVRSSLLTESEGFFFDSSPDAPRLNPKCVKCQLGNYSLTRQVHLIRVEKLRQSIVDYQNKIAVLDKKNNWQNALLKAIFSQIELKKQEQSQYSLDVRTEDKLLLEKLHLLFSAGGGLASIVDDYAKKSRLLRLLLDTSATMTGATSS